MRDWPKARISVDQRAVAAVVVATGVLLNIADAVATADAVADVAGGDSMVVVVVMVVLVVLVMMVLVEYLIVILQIQ